MGRTLMVRSPTSMHKAWALKDFRKDEGLPNNELGGGTVAAQPDPGASTS
jgi:hypothetical protein